MAWSPYRDAVISYVSRHPGCSKWDVASYCTHSVHRCPSKQYYIPNTALRNGWITGRQVGRQYRLYVPTAESKDKVVERRARRLSKPHVSTLAERLHKAVERRCYWRRVPKIPWLQPLEAHLGDTDDRTITSSDFPK